MKPTENLSSSNNITNRNLSFMVIAVSTFLLFAIPWMMSVFVDQRIQSAIHHNFVFASNWLSMIGICVGLGIFYRTLALRGRGIFLINASFAFLFFVAVAIPNIIDRRNPQPGFGLPQALLSLLLIIFLFVFGRGIQLIYRSIIKTP